MAAILRFLYCKTLTVWSGLAIAAFKHGALAPTILLCGMKLERSAITRSL